MILFGAIGINYNLLSMLAIPFGVLILIAKDTISLNLDNGTYSVGMSVFNKTIYRWTPLPKIEYVSIFPTQLTQRINSARTGHGSTIGYTHLRINLIYGRNRRLHVYSSKTLEDVKQKALYFGERLNVGVYDCTGSENVWIRHKVEEHT
jgi:hypothetical protein